MRLASLLVLAACGPHAAPSPPPAPPPDALPASLVDYMQLHAWGGMHLEWHSVRRWDLLPPAAVEYAQRQGWSRAPRQEGEAGNGVEFLAMHRAMLEVLVQQAPDARAYFTGWAAPPTDPHDARDPLPHGALTAFDPDMLAALDRVEHHLDGFASEDELGLYLETAMRPTTGHPEARAADRSTGVHNYLHNRFQDPQSPIDMGNPQVNLLNPRFWRLHGWIDHVWAAYRAQAHLSDDDPAYRKEMDVARGAMTMKMKGTMTREPPPQSLLDAVRP